MKNGLLHNEQGNIRLDVFIQKDREYLAGHIARFNDERRKLLAAGGSRISAALLARHTAADASDSWLKKKPTSVVAADTDVADMMTRAIDKLKSESARKLTQDDVRLWIMSDAFPNEIAASGVDFAVSTYFNSPASLSQFIAGKRHMKTAQRNYAKRWASRVLGGTLRPHDDSPPPSTHA